VPEAAHDDQWDSAAGAFAALTNRPSAASLYAFV